jgi:hypothetical protein
LPAEPLPDYLRPERRLLSSALASYAYGENDPLFFIDLDGRDAGIVFSGGYVPFIDVAPNCLSGFGRYYRAQGVTCKNVVHRPGKSDWCANKDIIGPITKDYFAFCIPTSCPVSWRL